MNISLHPYAIGVSLIAATTVALAPVAVALPHTTLAVPRPAMSDVRLAVSPAEIDAAITELDAALQIGTTSLATAAGAPGLGLIGVVDNITAGFDQLFTTLMNATNDPTLKGSSAVLRTFAVDAWAMLAHNLTRINAIITGTTADVGDLLTTAIAGTLRTMLIAGVNVVNAPLAPASYAGLLTAGVATGQLLAGNTLEVVQAVGDAGFDIAGIVVDELTFQLNNAVDGGLGTLLTQLGDASGSPIAKAVVAAVRGLAFAPALAVVNVGSHVVKVSIDTAKAGFDAVLDAPAPLVTSATTAAVRPRTAVAVPAQKPATKAGKMPGPRKSSAAGGTKQTSATGHSGRGSR